MSEKKQLVVIGAGPGGYAAAFYAADHGMDVTLIDKEVNPGGVCLYRGCIPSKALLHISKLIHEAEEASKWGVTFGKPKIDLDKLREFKNNVVKKLTGGTGQLSKQRKINYIQGTASFVNSNTLTVQKEDGSNEEVSFEKAILATGSVPAEVPGISIDSPKVWDSTDALELETIPKKLLVVGGGYIGLELGSVYAALGTKVTIVELMPGILPGADKDLVKVLQKTLEKSVDRIMLSTKVVDLKETKTGLKVKFEGEGVEEAEQQFDRILVSVGRRPVTEGLGLENTQVSVNERGFVEVNDQLATSDPAIFAIGDIVGGAMLAHKASAEAKVAVDVISGKKAAFEPNAIPAVVFTDPELAWAGLSETDAKNKGIEVEVARFPWAASGRATTIDRNDGLTKLIIDTETTRILGVGIVGAGAGEMISEGVLAVEMAALAKDVAMSIHPHPTLSETVMEAAEVHFGEATHLYRPKRK
jgi:dihydrolipoamide dehydrogenase